MNLSTIDSKIVFDSGEIFSISTTNHLQSGGNISNTRESVESTSIKTTQKCVNFYATTMTPMKVLVVLMPFWFFNHQYQRVVRIVMMIIVRINTLWMVFLSESPIDRW